VKTLAELIHEAHATAQSKGWHDEPMLRVDADGKQHIDHTRVLAKHALIHSEIAELYDSLQIRELPMYDAGSGKPEGWLIEAADVLIRIFDTAGALGLPLAEAVRKLTGSVEWLRHAQYSTRPVGEIASPRSRCRVPRRATRARHRAALHRSRDRSRARGRMGRVQREHGEGAPERRVDLLRARSEHRTGLGDEDGVQLDPTPSARRQASMSVHVHGTCSCCGGPVTTPTAWFGVVPPTPTCSRCGAVPVAAFGPVLPMRPARRHATIDATALAPFVVTKAELRGSEKSLPPLAVVGPAQSGTLRHFA
jgi:hypothetical protein